MLLLMTDINGRKKPATLPVRSREELAKERERLATAPFRAVIDYFRLDVDRHSTAADTGTDGPASQPARKRD